MNTPPTPVHPILNDFTLRETVHYPNGGTSAFYELVTLPRERGDASPEGAHHKDANCEGGTGSIAIIVDEGICDVDPDSNGAVFDYSLITSKQNEYVARNDRVYRFLREDLPEAARFLRPTDGDSAGVDSAGGDSADGNSTGISSASDDPASDISTSYDSASDAPGLVRRSPDRGNLANASPLEMAFEEHFANVYGGDATRFLTKEYPLTDMEGHDRYIDYLVRTEGGLLGVEENGVSFHHPQIIGVERYREQLLKQNSCQHAGIKLYRFSSQDCRFADRFEDDIRSYFGKTTDGFVASGLTVGRDVTLYEHQEGALDEMARRRAQGTKCFLAVFPTASGKSLIVEKDIARFAREREDVCKREDAREHDDECERETGRKRESAREPKTGHGTFQALIAAPSTAIVANWQARISADLPALADCIMVCTYGFINRHYAEYAPDHFDYIVIDEAHHAVAPALKRTIQHFDPAFLVGLTATDKRPDKKRLEDVFGSYRVELSLSEAMEAGIIARARAFRVETNIDLSEVRINGKDYVNADLERSVRVTSRNELIVDVVREYFCDGEAAKRQGVIFCVNVRHADEMERLLCAAGISAKAISGRTRNAEAIMDDFREGRVRFLCSCQMISEGWDYPELGILVMARPTLSRVLYVQQLGRGLRKTPTKRDVFVIDVVDRYGSMVVPCSLHSIFQNPYYVPFGDVLRRDYRPGDFVEVDGLHERIERIVEIDVQSFAEKYEGYLSVEQVAREFFVSTGTVGSWIKRGRVEPTVTFRLGSRPVHLFSPEDVEAARVRLGIPVHSDETIRDDFFAFLAERDYSLSYKMPFMLGLLSRMDRTTGDARIDDVLDDYIAFYRDRIERGLVVDRAACPYDARRLADRAFVKRSMLANPFEKFERKRFMYYSKDLGVISLNHALLARLSEADFEAVRAQMVADLEDYYAKIG